MAKYRNPQYKALAEAGTADNKAHLRNANLSVANNHSNNYAPTKTSGIKIRGTGAATKGTLARGPMA
tara:strand:+ start:500 stop:700 length:201 start_codon:yes stop_codon:yes gene_type:complete